MMLFSQSKRCEAPNPAVVSLGEIRADALRRLLTTYGLELRLVRDGAAIPGSFWGEPEAGLIRNCLYARSDTPLHSVLHEACHFICMPASRREDLDTNAGGDYQEESAVCYLQILLADHVPAIGRARLMQDMDAWGYSFRLGSAQGWFEQDAEDAKSWLLEHGLILDSGEPSGRLRLT